MLSTSRSLCLLFPALLALLSRDAEAQAIDWPRTIEVPEGRVVIYQPQLESFKGIVLSGRSAIAVTPAGEVKPSFGAAWFKARIETNRGERTVEVTDVNVAGIRFPEATKEQRQKLTDLLEAHFESSDLSISLDQLLTSLALVEQQRRDDQLRNRPPRILVSAERIQVIPIDGEPALRPEGSDGVLRVLNVPCLLYLDNYPDGLAETYYLRTSGRWYWSSGLQGDYERVDSVPDKVLMLAAARPEPESDKLTSGLRDAEILVVTEPTELIRTFGEPAFTAIGETDLQYVNNTAGDLFLEVSTDRRFLLLSGRWYSAGKFEGPWEFVASDQLPADFAKIPPDSKKGDVLTFVAGTDEAREAVLDTRIPQTAVVDRKTARLSVAYDGVPKFELINGTELRYAVNTSHSVILVGGKYYCCDAAVWFVSDGPTGPWVVCDSVPQGIYDLPPSCPVYNLKFVHVYYSTPEVAYVGYTPGYVGCYVQDGTIVYGTGYPYPCSAASVWLPRPRSYGFASGYNPITGNWGADPGVAGPYGYAAIGSVSSGWWGPAGYVCVDRGLDADLGHDVDMDIDADHENISKLEKEFNQKHNIDRHRRTIYDQRQDLADRQGERRNEKGRYTPREGRGERASASAREKPGGQNNHLADKDGFVCRRNQDGSWELWTKGEWQNHAPQQPSNLDRQLYLRQRGEWRTDSFDSLSGGTSRRRSR